MVRQVATGSDVSVIPADVVLYVGLTFSPDGQYIYFTSSSKENDLYNILLTKCRCLAERRLRSLKTLTQV